MSKFTPDPCRISIIPVIYNNEQITMYIAIIGIIFSLQHGASSTLLWFLEFIFNNTSFLSPNTFRL
jgi:hypothetical protein